MRTQLPRTYYAFLARFRHPTPIQRRAAGPLLEGKSALLVAATASGKTEAFLAPLVERNFEALKSGRQHILLVCPTRALVNDAARRLAQPLKSCGLELRRRTSDASENPAESPAGLWITTPEGLDSLLCRHARWLGGTAAVILDEIHLLHGTPRGTHALCLLERLDWVCRAVGSPPPQRVAATATATQPEDMAGSFLGSEAAILREEAGRPVRLHYHRFLDWENLRDTLADLPAARKVLLFAGSRSEAEEAAIHLRGRPPFGSNVYVHHSSLSRPLRLAAERAFLRQTCALMCSTTTMEVGVDVGDIDWTVLLHPPEQRLNFIQRSGRSGRRSGTAQAVACYREEAERARYRYFLERGEAPMLSTGKIPQHDSVVVQQALSLLYQNPRKQVGATAILQRLPQELGARWQEEDLEQLLQRLAEQGWLQNSAGLYTPGPKSERAFRRGQMHANIGSANQKQVEIRDAFSGRLLGTVDSDARGRIPGQIRLAGQAHRLRRDFRKQTVLAEADEAGSDAKFVAMGPAAPVELESSQDFGRWLNLGPRCLLSGPQGNLLGHFLGSCWGQILRRHLSSCYPQAVIYADAFVVAWQGSFVEEVWNRDALWGCLQKFAPSLRGQLQLGRWFSHLPRGRQRQELARQLRWDWVDEVWLKAPLTSVAGREAEPLKQLLQKEGELTIEGFFPISAEDL